MRCFGSQPTDRFSDDLDEGNTGPVVVYEGVTSTGNTPVGTSDMEGFSSIFLHVSTLDLNAEGLAIGLDVEPAVIANRFVVLGGLIILRHVRVEVVLPGHAAPLGNVTVESQTNPNGRFDGMTVDGRHGSGQTQANRANIGIGILVSIG